MEFTITINNETISFGDVSAEKYELLEKATKLYSENGLKLGNYNYNVERYVCNFTGETTISLTRWFEECKDCPLYDNECDGENAPANFQNYPCSKMLPVIPFCDNYEFTQEEFEEEDEYTEFNAVERMAIQMLFENENVIKLYELPFYEKDNE